LHSNDTTEWASVGWVDDLDEADTGLACNGSRAGGAGWNSNLDGVVLVDVGSTLDDTHVDEHAGNEAALLGGGDVAFGAWNLLSDFELSAGGEGTGSSGVADGSVRTGSVSGDDVDGSGEGAAGGSLGKGAAGLGHDGAHAREGVSASLGLSESIGCGSLGGEDGGVDFGLLVGSGTWDDASLDTETSGVSTSITSLKAFMLVRQG